MCIFDHISKKVYVWPAEVVICQKLTHGTINQVVLKAVQSQRTSFESILEFQKQEAACIYKKKNKKKKLFPLFLRDPLALCSLHIFCAYHQYIT